MLTYSHAILVTRQDTGSGTGAGNYETTDANGGPSHRVVDGLRLGRNVDIESGNLQNGQANADDVAGALPDDEDGVLTPASDLLGSIGASPTVTLLVTNTSGSTATLAGWIDYDNDGLFEAVERTTSTISTGMIDGRVTLTFPTVPDGFAGRTYARFRLSTDGSFVANPTSIGTADDGEVEDYTFSITDPSGGGAVSSVAVNSNTTNGPVLTNGDAFGTSAAALGDLDGDGVPDVAVGAHGDGEGGDNRGAVHVLFLNADGSVKQRAEINSSTSNGPTLLDGDSFGRSMTSLGDLDGDGVADLAVGADFDDATGNNQGAVHILFLNTDGSVKQTAEINNNTLNGPTLSDRDYFGTSVASLGDLDGDGIVDLAVGARYDDAGGTNRGAVHILFLNADGSVKQTAEVNSNTANGPTLANRDSFGASITSPGDLDGDGVADIAVSATGDDAGGSGRGAVHILFLNADGSVKQTSEINSTTANGPTLSNGDGFGSSLTSLGDLDGDGVTDLAVGAVGDDEGGNRRGALHILLLNSDGSVDQASEINSGTTNGPGLTDGDFFGSSVASPGDLDGDGMTDLVVGAMLDDEGGSDRGTLHVLFLTLPNTAPTVSVANLSYTEDDNNGDSVIIDPAAQVNDPDGDTEWSGGTLTVLVAENSEATDEISISQGGGITLSGPNVQTNGSTTFGVITENSGIANDGIVNNGDLLTITFNSNATNALVQDLVRTISYRTTSDTPGTMARTLTLTMTDARGAVGTDTSAVSVTSVADTPIVTSPAVTTTINAASFMITGTAEANSLVQVYSDVNNNGLTDGADAVIASQQLSSGATAFSIVTSLTQNTANDFVVTVTDASGDQSTTVDVPTITEDSVIPTVTITPDGTTTTASPIVFTIQFSETVTGFSADDVSITNGSVETFTPVNGDTFTLAVAPAAPGTVTVSVPQDSAQDFAGNGNLSNSAAVTSAAPGTVNLPGAGSYEALLEGGDLVLRVAGGAEHFRRSVTAVSVLEITGSAGADVITVLDSGGAVGTPILFIGMGDSDLFDASLATGSTTLLGGGGDDTLTGGTGDDFIIGGSGKDVLSGGAGGDRLFGRSGPDALTGGEGNDTIGGGSGRDTIAGGMGADILIGGGGFDTISGGNGSDRIFGGPGRDVLDGDGDDDTLFGGGGADDIAGGLGNDTLNSVFRNDAFNQVVARDTLIGGQRPSGRPASAILLLPASASVSPRFLIPPALNNDEASDGQNNGDTEDITHTDQAFTDSLLPELLEV